MKKTRIIVCLIVLSAVAVACSGRETASTDDGASSAAVLGGTASPGVAAGSPGQRPATSASANLRARFIAQGDRICSGFHRQEAALESRLRSGQESQAGYYGNVARLLRAALARFRSLQPPARDLAVIGRYLNLVGESSSTFDELARAREAGDREEERQLVRRVIDIGEQTRAMARSYGFRVCGSG